MALMPETRNFLAYLQKNKAVRDRIRADRDRTLLYAGNFIKPMWREIADLKRTSSSARQLQLLPDVLEKIKAPISPPATLKAYVEALTDKVPWKPDGFIIWRALSGIFASNALGRVYFQVGSCVLKQEKVLAATEVSVLQRNPNIDGQTKEIVAWLHRCIENGTVDINFGVLP